MQQSAQVDALREQIELLKDQLNREQEQADHWHNQATLLLTHQPEIKTEQVVEPVKSLLWKKLFGKR